MFAHAEAVLVLVLVAASHVTAQVVSYDGTSFPEDAEQGWTRLDRVFLADRFLDAGWLIRICLAPPAVHGTAFWQD